jgi:hypothetical protein
MLSRLIPMSRDQLGWSMQRGYFMPEAVHNISRDIVQAIRVARIWNKQVNLA